MAPPPPTAQPRVASMKVTALRDALLPELCALQAAPPSVVARMAPESPTAHSWAVGEGGAILATTDGGATWKAQSAQISATLNAVTFVDARRGWAVGEGGVILATTNGGAAWKAQSAQITATLNAVAFVDATHGWAAGSGGIFATTNGGAAWKAQSAGISATLNAITFLSTTRGWAVGGGGAILATTSGGFSAAPRIVKLQPASGKRGATVTLRGIGFGAAPGASFVKFGARRCAAYLSWSDTRIRCTAPANARLGVVKVRVTTTAGKSNARSFRVKR